MRNDNVVALLGGLGNQLFQIAFGQWLERETERTTVYDVSFLRASPPAILEIEFIGDYARERILWSTRAWPTPDGRLGRLGRVMRRVPTKRAVLRDYSALGYSNPTIDHAAWWFGYWQRLHYTQLLLPRLAEALDCLSDQTRRPSIGVHVRRGDMVGLPASVPARWFHVALCHLGLATDTVLPVRVWSDDPDWCRKELRLGVPFEIAERASAVEDMASLARCTSLIISRSTFSWWAARVAAERGATIVYPTPWAANAANCDVEIIPPRWLPVTIAAAGVGYDPG